MTSFARPRIALLAVAGVCAVASLTARPLWRGAFAADVEMTSPGGDPLRLGVHGGIGPERPQPATTVTEVRVVGAGSDPFNGPTAEERAAIDSLRAALHEQWLQMRAMVAHTTADDMHGDDADLRRALAYPEPDVPQPPRHLTPYEIAEIERAAATVRRAVAAAR